MTDVPPPPGDGRARSSSSSGRCRPAWLVDATVGGGGHARLLLEARPDLAARRDRPGPRRAGGRGGDASLRSATGSPCATPASTTSTTVMTDLASPSRRPACCSTSASARPSSTAPSGASATATTARSTCAWTPTEPVAPPTSSTATPRRELAACSSRARRRALRQPHRPAIVAARPDRDHRRARRASCATPSPRPPAAAAATRPSARSRPSASRSTTSSTILPGAIDAAIDVAAPGRPRRRASLPLGRGPHREGPLPPRRDRRLHLPARPAVRVRRRADRPPAAAGGVEADRGRGRAPTPGPSRPACAPPRSSPSTSSAGVSDDRARLGAGRRRARRGGHRCASRSRTAEPRPNRPRSAVPTSDRPALSAAAAPASWRPASSCLALFGVDVRPRRLPGQDRRRPAAPRPGRPADRATPRPPTSGCASPSPSWSRRRP